MMVNRISGKLNVNRSYARSILAEHNIIPVFEGTLFKSPKNLYYGKEVGAVILLTGH